MPRIEPLPTRARLTPRELISLYRKWLLVHATQECFAAAGIAIAVALVFAATVAQSSIAGASGEVVKAVTGPATLQLRARSGQGFPEGLLRGVERLPGVKLSAPLLEQTATLRAPGGRHTTIDLAGTDTSLAILDGLAETLPLAALQPGTIGISKATAEALGITAHSRFAGHGDVTLKLRGTATTLRVSAVLGSEAVGALSRALVAVMPLARMQQLAGRPGQITRIFIETQPGAQAKVRSELRALAAGRLTVAPADQDVTLLRQALGPSALASGLFAAIGALLGFLLAFNAMLLTVPDRRRVIAVLRMRGTRRSGIRQMVLSQALCLGIVASLIGLGVGYLLSIAVFHQSSAYLAEAFTLGSGAVVGLRPVLLAFCGGVLATCLASTVPLLDLRRSRSRDAVRQQDAVPGETLTRPARRRLEIGAVSLLLGAGALYALIPSAAIAATGLLALGSVLAVPLVFMGVLALMRAVIQRFANLTALPVALAALRATTLRSLALAATGAVALLGTVALGGSRENLLRGIHSFAHSYSAAADVWVTNPGDNQAVDEFSPGQAVRQISTIPAVASVQTFQGSFLELGSRRVWMIARPPGAARAVLDSEILQGNPRDAVARLGERGWIVVSKKIAEEHHVTVGGYLTLPTPTGSARLRIAATTTNLVWPPGAIFISTADYSRLWATSAPTALAVHLRPGANVQLARDQIARALGSSTGLEVATAAKREASIDTLASEGLEQLHEISTLLLLAAIATMAVALLSSLSQRRAWLARSRLKGAKPPRLRLVLLLEALLILGSGCLTGALAGVYGEVIIDGFLRQVTGFPLASIVTGARPLELFAIVLAATLAIVVFPGWRASHISSGLALEGD
jgi:putative ABC transport system permease protein